MRYRLSTLLIVLAVGPPLVAGLWYLLRNEPVTLISLAGIIIYFGGGFGILWLVVKRLSKGGPT